MIIGVGTDMIEIARVKAAASKESFLKRYFTDNEIKRYSLLSNNASSIAADFSAKEAVVKAMGTGFRGFSSKDIEIGRDELGKPTVKTYGRCAEICIQNGIDNIYISLSHCNDYAIGFAVAEKKED